MRIGLSSGWKKENPEANNNARRGGNFLNTAELQPHGESMIVAHAAPSPDTKMLLHRHLNHEAERLTLLGDTMYKSQGTSRVQSHSYRQSIRQEELNHARR
jgi:hypothetical protein